MWFSLDFILASRTRCLPLSSKQPRNVAPSASSMPSAGAGVTGASNMKTDSEPSPPQATALFPLQGVSQLSALSVSGSSPQWHPFHSASVAGAVLVKRGEGRGLRSEMWAAYFAGTLMEQDHQRNRAMLTKDFSVQLCKTSQTGRVYTLITPFSNFCYHWVDRSPLPYPVPK